MCSSVMWRVPKRTKELNNDNEGGSGGSEGELRVDGGIGGLQCERGILKWRWNLQRMSGG